MVSFINDHKYSMNVDIITTDSANNCKTSSDIFRSNKGNDNKSPNYNNYTKRIYYENNSNGSVSERFKANNKNNNRTVSNHSTEFKRSRELDLANGLRKHMSIIDNETNLSSLTLNNTVAYKVERVIKEKVIDNDSHDIEIRKNKQTTTSQKANEHSTLRDSFFSKLEAPKSFLYQTLVHKKQLSPKHIHDNMFESNFETSTKPDQYKFECKKQINNCMQIPLSKENTVKISQNNVETNKSFRVVHENTSFLNSRIADFNSKFSKIAYMSKRPLQKQTVVHSNVIIAPQKKSIKIFTSIKDNERRQNAEVLKNNDISTPQINNQSSYSYVPMNMQQMESEKIDDKFKKKVGRRIIYDVLLNKQRDLALEDRGYYDVHNSKEKSMNLKKDDDFYHWFKCNGLQKRKFRENSHFTSETDNAITDNVYEELEIECLPQINSTRHTDDLKKLSPLARSPNSWNLCNNGEGILSSKSNNGKFSFMNSLRRKSDSSQNSDNQSYETVTEKKITKIIEGTDKDKLLEYDSVDVKNISPKYYVIPEYDAGIKNIEYKGRFNITKVKDLNECNVPSIEVEEYLEPIVLEPEYCDVDIKGKEETIVGAFLKKFEYNSKVKENNQKSSEETKRIKEVTNQPIPNYPTSAAKPPRDEAKHSQSSKGSFSEKPLEALQKWNETFKSTRKEALNSQRRGELTTLGPLDQSMCSNAGWKRGTSMVDRPLPVPIENEFYYMEVSRTNAEKLLEGHADGTFILRPSSKVEHAYTLTLVYGGKVYNIGCRKRPDNRLALGYSKPFELSFLCIKDLIEHYYREKIILISNGVSIGSTQLRKLNC